MISNSMPVCLAGVGLQCHNVPTLYHASPYSATPVAQDFTSFSIEFKDLPLFAGNKSAPNQFSNNLLSNLGGLTGVMPKIRIGGTTQDDAIFVADQTEPVITIGTTNGTNRAGVTIGPSYFSSWGTFPAGTSYIAGINLAANGTNGTETRQNEARLISQALSPNQPVESSSGNGSSLDQYEIGNEPDLFSYWNRRPASWNVTDYVSEWHAAQRDVASAGNETNSGFIYTLNPYFGPSFAGTDVGSGPDSLSPLAAFQNGLDSDLAYGRTITEISGHNYIGSATASGVTLQGTLMNHTEIVNSISSHVTLAKELKKYSSAPYVMGETNSLSGGGATGLSNVFGAALWVVDYTLWQATQGIGRVHFHQSGTSPYSAWAPSTDPPTTNAPYYGNVMAASAIGEGPKTSISYLDLACGDSMISAYAIYENERIASVVALNMIEYTSNSTQSRGSVSLAVKVPGRSGAEARRLKAAGADVATGVTFGGISYDYNLGQGKPIVVNATDAKEVIYAQRDGTLCFELSDSEAVLLKFF